MRSEIRVRNTGSNAQRVVTISHLDRTILVMKNNFTYGGTTGKLTTYENSEANGVLKTLESRNRGEMNQGVTQAIKDFFANDPNIDGEKARSGCLYRGQ